MGTTRRIHAVYTAVYYGTPKFGLANGCTARTAPVRPKYALSAAQALEVRGTHTQLVRRGQKRQTVSYIRAPYSAVTIPI